MACTPPPTEVDTDLPPTGTSRTTGTTTNTVTSTDTTGTTNATMGMTTGPICPPVPPDGGGYDPCPGLCGGGGQCFNDGSTYAVCTRGCFMACDCWEAPGGDAPVSCSDDLLMTTSVCVLDCSGGQTCPSGMFCVPDLGICAHPFPGSGTTTGWTSRARGRVSRTAAPARRRGVCRNLRARPPWGRSAWMTRTVPGALRRSAGRKGSASAVPK